MSDELLDAIWDLHQTLRLRGYQGKAPEVQALIDRVRQELTGEHGLGKWETFELAHAQDAVSRNWLAVALFCAEKAIVVNRLPTEEYEYGYNYTNRR